MGVDASLLLSSRRRKEETPAGLGPAKRSNDERTGVHSSVMDLLANGALGRYRLVPDYITAPLEGLGLRAYSPEPGDSGSGSEFMELSCVSSKTTSLSNVMAFTYFCFTFPFFFS